MAKTKKAKKKAKKKATSKRTSGHQRLLKLAELLERLPPSRFDYNQWVGEDWKGKPSLSCGTTACALGWATTIPELRREGLHLVKAGHDEDFNHVALGRRHGMEAAEKLFGITYNEARALFDGAGLGRDGTWVGSDARAEAILLPWCKLTESAAFVAARIRTLVAWREMPPKARFPK